MTSDDTFELYDLEVTVEGDEKDFVCRHHAGHAFRVEGEDLVFPEGGRFSMYALAATARQGTPHLPERLDDDRCAHRLSRSQLRSEVQDPSDRKTHPLARRMHRRAAGHKGLSGPATLQPGVHDHDPSAPHGPNPHY